MVCSKPEVWHAATNSPRTQREASKINGVFVTANCVPGRPYPLGSTWDGEGVNFALYSEHAEKVELCLFDITGKREILRVPLPEQTDMVWHGYLPECVPGSCTDIECLGPYAPEKGIALITTSFFSIPMESRCREAFAGAMLTSDTKSGVNRKIYRSTAATMRPACRRTA